MTQPGQIRARLTEELAAAALEEYDDDASAYLNPAESNSHKASGPMPDSSLPVKLRSLGAVQSFRGVLSGAPAGAGLLISRKDLPGAVNRPWLAGLIGAVALPLLTWWRVRGKRRSAWPERTVLLALLAIVAVAAGPVWLAAALAVAVGARLSGL